MSARLAADLVMLLHLAFVIFVVLGGLLVARYAWLAALHLPAVAWGAWIEITGGVCPLTWVENDLRRRSGAGAMREGFIEHYIYPVLYPPGLTREVQWLLAAVVIVGNLALYGWLLRRRLSRRGRESTGHVHD